MTIAKVIVLSVCSVVLLLSPLLRHRPKIQNDVHFIAVILICNAGVGVVETLLNTSWLLSLVLTSIYLVLLMLLTKAIDSKLSSTS